MVGVALRAPPRDRPFPVYAFAGDGFERRGEFPLLRRDLLSAFTEFVGVHPRRPVFYAPTQKFRVEAYDFGVGEPLGPVTDLSLSRPAEMEVVEEGVLGGPFLHFAGGSVIEVESGERVGGEARPRFSGLEWSRSLGLVAATDCKLQLCTYVGRPEPEGILALLDAATGAAVGEVVVPSVRDAGPERPGYLGDLELSRDGRTAYVTSSLGRLHVVDLAGRAVRAEWEQVYEGRVFASSSVNVALLPR